MRRSQRWTALAFRPTWAPVVEPGLLQKQNLRVLVRRASSVPRSNSSEPHVRGEKATIPTRRLKSEFSLNHQNLHDDQQIIIPDSLADTLRAHRKANEESILIRKRNTARDSTSPNKPYTKPYKLNSDAVHLDLDRDEKEVSSHPDYEGKIRGLSFDWEVLNEIGRDLSQPWMKLLDSDDSTRVRDSAADRLSKEIRAVDALFTPSAKEVEAAKLAVKDIQSAVITTDTGDVSSSKLDLIGSRASGLTTPLSDLDLNLVLGETLKPSSDNASFRALAELANRLKYGDNKQRGKKKHRNPAIQVSYFASKARVPIIVGLHAPTGLEFQIQCASTGYGSLETVKLLAAEYPTITALFKVIKQMLKMRGLADGSKGGLSSYPLLIMIAVALKQDVAQSNPYDIGSHLLHFLKFYSRLDFYKEGITHVPSKHLLILDSDATAESFFTKQKALGSIDLITQDPVGAIPMLFNRRHTLHEIHRFDNSFKMTLHDPANPYNDLGRSAYQIKHVQATFLDLSVRLKERMSEWDRNIRAYGEPTKHGVKPSLLSPLLRGDYSMYNLERNRLCSWIDEQKTKSPP